MRPSFSKQCQFKTQRHLPFVSTKIQFKVALLVSLKNKSQKNYLFILHDLYGGYGHRVKWTDIPNMVMPKYGHIKTCTPNPYTKPSQDFSLHYNLVEFKTKTKNIKLGQMPKRSKGRGESEMKKLITSSPFLPILIHTLAWKSATWYFYFLFIQKSPFCLGKVPKILKGEVKKSFKPPFSQKTVVSQVLK